MGYLSDFAGSGWNLEWIGLHREDKVHILFLYFLIAVFTVAGFISVKLIGQYNLLLSSLAIAAYVLGLRHGVDADHIAAIDNTTRKLMHEGKKPLTVGTWFSLGHSTVVVGLVVLLVLATRSILSIIPSLKNGGFLFGTTVSGVFLWAIGIINIFIVYEIYRIFRGLREGKLDEKQLEEQMNKRGFMNRYFSHLFKIIKKPWQIYPVGVLFGLGFDTATEVLLISVSVGLGVTSSVPLWMILALPFMFTCGMVLVDTSDAVAMRMAYGWAYSKPIRKIYYNLTITIISVLVAFVIGSVELLQVLSGELNLTGWFWNWLSSLDFETLGVIIVGLFIISWFSSFVYYKYKNFEDGYIIPSATSQPR